MAEQSGTTQGTGGGTIKVLIVAVVLVAVVAVFYAKGRRPASRQMAGPAAPETGAASARLPRLVDLGADKCIPCKLMAPILEEMKTAYAGRLVVEFIDVWKNPDAGKKHGVEIIPTQIFFDPSGKELFRHQGFFSKDDILAKWKELGFDLNVAPGSTLVREIPLVPDSRQADLVCSMCDGPIDPKTRIAIDTAKGKVGLCSPHCFFIYYSSLRDADSVTGKVTVTDWPSGHGIPAERAFFVSDGKPRPAILAFADKEAAAAECAKAKGTVLAWNELTTKELETRCGFCDRAVYPVDASTVKTEDAATWGCCPMCALGVAARLKKDITVEQKDALTGEIVHVETTDFSVSQLKPSTAVAWHGQKKGPEGKMVSAGCFKQFFFASEANLRQWLEKHPEAAGKMQTIHQALADKMKLTPAQIGNACKIGECKPK